MRVKRESNWLFLTGLALFLVFGMTMFFGWLTAEAANASVFNLSRSADVSECAR